MEGEWKCYWLHIEAPAAATLAQLDRFLRDIWLECCGHMSAFTIGEQRYSVSPSEDLFSGVREKSMKLALGAVLSPRLKLYHEYDFGTPTRLRLTVVARRERANGGNDVKLLARNEPPDMPCQECGKPAAQVCTQCMYEGPEGWLCEKHAAEHECGEDYFLPVVNSPRVGVCGYTG